jgi:hypothetical protein
MFARAARSRCAPRTARARRTPAADLHRELQRHAGDAFDLETVGPGVERRVGERAPSRDRRRARAQDERLERAGAQRRHALAQQTGLRRAGEQKITQRRDCDRAAAQLEREPRAVAKGSFERRAAG